MCSVVLFFTTILYFAFFPWSAIFLVVLVGVFQFDLFNVSRSWLLVGCHLLYQKLHNCQKVNLQLVLPSNFCLSNCTTLHLCAALYGCQIMIHRSKGYPCCPPDFITSVFLLTPILLSVNTVVHFHLLCITFNKQSGTSSFLIIFHNLHQYILCDAFLLSTNNVYW